MTYREAAGLLPVQASCCSPKGVVGVDAGPFIVLIDTNTELTEELWSLVKALLGTESAVPSQAGATVRRRPSITGGR
jgi:hypothetical protein